MAALGVMALLVPFPYQVQARATTRTVAVPVNVNAPHAGTVASVEVHDGQWVEKGTVLLKYDAAEASARVAKLKAELKEKEARLKKARTPNPKAKAASAAMAKADAAELKARAELDAARASKKKPAIAKAEKAHAAAAKTAQAARKAAVAAGGGDDIEQLQLEVKATNQQLEALSQDVAAAEVKAPQSGSVVGLMAKAGAGLAKDAAVLRLEDARTLAVDLEVSKKDARGLKVGQEVSLRLGGKKFAATLTQVSETGVVATLDNTKGELRSGTEGTATIANGDKSALGRM
jgi:HlyD family secretion protein